MNYIIMRERVGDIGSQHQIQENDGPQKRNAGKPELHADGSTISRRYPAQQSHATAQVVDPVKATLLSFENMHNYGNLFANLFKARRQAFIVQNHWDLPEADGMEYDQYDTPASRWVAVHRGEKILAGIRLTPTTAKCGIYTYMIRDAQRGLLESIPSDLLDFEAPIDPDIWESSRVFIASDVSAKLRTEVQSKLMMEMIKGAGDLGARQILGLVPAVWSRWIRRLKLDASPAGPVMRIDDVNTQVAMMNLGPAKGALS